MKIKYKSKYLALHNYFLDHENSLLLLLPPSVLTIILFFVNDLSFLLAHTLAELFSVIVASVACLVALTSQHFSRNHYIIVLSVAIGWCAVLDILHMLCYPGMNLFSSTQYDANLSIQFWLAARFLQASALLIAPLMLSRQVNMAKLHLLFGSFSLGMLWIAAKMPLPLWFAQDYGLTGLKITAEYLIIIMLCGGWYFLYRQRHKVSSTLFVNMCLSIAITILSELLFTQYKTTDGLVNLIGHILKIYAYWFIYIALVNTTLKKPFGDLTQVMNAYDAIPEPTFIVNQQGLIQQANSAAERYLQQSKRILQGKSAHQLLHNVHIPIASCPICRHLVQSSQKDFLEKIRLEPHKTLECHLAPFQHDSQGDLTWVMVIRDISRNERLTEDRERLVSNLAARVQELRYLNEIIQQCKHSHLSLAELFTAMLRLIPLGLGLKELKIRIQTQWGSFGEPVLAKTYSEFQLEQEQQHYGTIFLWDSTAITLYLSQEQQRLMGQICAQLVDAVVRMMALERIQRLSFFYATLSATNRAISHTQTQQQLLETVQQSLLQQQSFDQLFIALPDETQQLTIYFSHHIEQDMLPTLQKVVNQLHLSLHNAVGEYASDPVIIHHVYDIKNANSFEYKAWQQYLHQQGIHQAAIMPILQERKLRGIIGLYSQSAIDFDLEQIQLLENLSADMSFALERFSSEEKLARAQSRSLVMAQRFSEIFRSSPVAMQIISTNTQQIKNINPAFEHWLGFSLTEIFELPQFLEKVIHQKSPEQGQALQQLFQGTLQQPLSEIYVKDCFGKQYVAQATSVIVNQEVIVSWVDLSLIHEKEQHLIESEQRFRNMVEQAVIGIYVRRDGRYIYVNPKFCELIGWSAEQLLGQEVLNYTSQDPENLESIVEAWQKLQQNPSRIVSYSLPLRCRHGQYREVEVQTRNILWDDQLPATIAMVYDITERKQAERKIARYLERLEGTIEGTLQAVSTMVELRDPYTAGHQRRVGLICRRIAEEFGWDEKRCQQMYYVGLVHDLGKISIPAELLNKPTRLNSLELELIKGHAQATYEILKDIPFDFPLAQIALQHHERLDGSGYPNALTSEQIYFEAKILAVADVIESMASHRPYRASLGLDFALKEIQQGRAKIYDAQVCDIVMQLFQEKHYVLPS